MMQQHAHATTRPVAGSNVREQISEAIRLSQELRSNKYREVAVFSCYWQEDDTGAEQDCDLFVETISKIQSDSCALKARIHKINVSDDIESLYLDCVTAHQQLDTSKRSLFVFHYAGHGCSNNSSDILTLALNDPHAAVGSIPEEQLRDFSGIEKQLERAADVNLNMDVLFVMDCCHAAAGKGSVMKHGRVEYIAAATTEGMNNCRQDCTSFTGAWCNAFNHLLAQDKAFNTQDVVDRGNLERVDSGLSNLFIIRDNGSLPVTFRPPNFIENGASEGSIMLLVAFHIEDDADDSKMKNLIEFLKKIPAPIAAIKVLKADKSSIDVEKPELLTGYIGRNSGSTSLLPATNKTGNEDDQLL